MKFNNPYWSNKTKIQMLQRWILVHSFLYYELNNSIVSDEMFDKNSKQLTTMKRKFAKSYKEALFGYAMKDFDGSTGYGFHNNLKEEHRLLIERDAYYLKQNIGKLKKWGNKYYAKQ